MLVEKRRRAVDREYREQMERQELGLSVAMMLGSMTAFTTNMVSESRRARERSITRIMSRSLSRSLSRPGASRTRDLSAHKVTSRRHISLPYTSLIIQGCADPVAKFHYNRTVDRMVKGFF